VSAEATREVIVLRGPRARLMRVCIGSAGREGFIVPIRDAEAIREKIVYLYEHPDSRDSMAQAARERVQHLGGWSDYGNRMLSVYEDALACRLGQRIVGSVG